MIRAVLFTSPGERVNRPDFGCGLRTLVFAPNSDALSGTTQLMVRAALQRWLEAELIVDEVLVEAQESTLTVRVAYTRRADGARLVDTFAGSGRP
jgi:phage baseplate assembly protein W